MRNHLLAMGVVLGISGTASAQSILPGGCFVPPSPYPPAWQQVRTRLIDVNCVPTRVVYLAPRPTYPLYPPVYPMTPAIPYPMPLAMTPPIAPQPVMAPPPPAMPAAPMPAPPVAEARPKAPPVFSTPTTPQVVSKSVSEANPDDVAASKLKLARYLEQDGKLEKARQRYQEIVRLHPNSPAAEEARQLLAANGG